jgi:penicillin amidase
MRAIYDLADLAASRFVIATGQSGNPFSRHYDDLNRLWRAGDSIALTHDESALREAARGALTLAPVRNAP